MKARTVRAMNEHREQFLVLRERNEDLEGALEDVLKAWDRYQQLLEHSLPGIEGEPPLVAAERDLEAEIEGARIVLQAGGAR